MFYSFRCCETCMQDRVPKSSHCSACDHCVVGWDHHCFLLNNCVGRRNYRSFVCFLVMSISFAGTVLINSLFLLLVGRPGYCESGVVQRVGTFLALCLLATFFWVFKRFIKMKGLKNKLLIVIQLAYMACAFATAQSVSAVFASVLISVSAIYIFAFRSMALDYLDLVGRKLTVKEREARKKTARDLNLDKSADLKNLPLPLKLRVQRMVNFFFLRKVPPSIIIGDRCCSDDMEED
mmetsp:Transcript_23901/g.32033  ORF Transcript_23901/g.32033 Transcript_23901/m.32033 type:complete len:236 (+) Transcript_23901:1120-1827(+)